MGNPLPPLTAEEYEALRSDIARRGVMVAVEIDADTGEIVDGAHRQQIAGELGIDYPRVERHFASDDERTEHALVLNLLRRRIDDETWADAFEELARLRGKTLLIMEVTRDYGQAKSGRIIEELARDAGTSAALIWYTQSRDPAATFTTKAGTFFDLTSFRVQRLWPPPRCVAVYDPPGWAAALLKLRRDHYVLEAEACSRRTAEWREREAAA
jgi:hypothetical protein